MKQQSQEFFHLDIINYLAIDSLEKIGNFEPTQTEISSMEEMLELSINSILHDLHERKRKR